MQSLTDMASNKEDEPTLSTGTLYGHKFPSEKFKKMYFFCF